MGFDLEEMLNSEKPSMVLWMRSPQEKRYSKEIERFFLEYESPQELYWYIKYNVKERWPEAEPIIMKNSKWALYYSINIIKGRWIEAEPYIRKDLIHWEEYCNVWRIND